MNRFQSFINRIGGDDKVLHFETCFLITMVVSFLNMNLFGLCISVSSLSACLISVVSGLLKELYDYKTYGLFDKKNIIADVLGSFAGLLIIILIV